MPDRELPAAELGPSDPPFTGPIRPQRVEVLLPSSFGRQVGPPESRWWLAALLFVLTLGSTTTLGAGYFLGTRTDVVSTLPWWLNWEGVRAVWGDPALLRIGLMFSLPTLFILLCHEMGHYLACRRHALPVTPPFFLPVPIGLGTFGAFIRIRGPIRGKRELLDVGAAGPIAGFIALLPFLVLGTLWSQPVPLNQAATLETAPMLLYLPGRSLLSQLVTQVIHGPLPAGSILDLHPFALAAWVGLFATMLNLLPLGQLDGGHVLYAAIGPWQRKLALPLWVLLGLGGFVWTGWLFWCVVARLLGLYHPPVHDENEALDPRRRWVAWATLAIFVLSFMPVPIAVLPVAG